MPEEKPSFIQRFRDRKDRSPNFEFEFQDVKFEARDLPQVQKNRSQNQAYDEASKLNLSDPEQYLNSVNRHWIDIVFPFVTKSISKAWYGDEEIPKADIPKMFDVFDLADISGFVAAYFEASNEAKKKQAG